MLFGCLSVGQQMRFKIDDVKNCDEKETEKSLNSIIETILLIS